MKIHITKDISFPTFLDILRSNIGGIDGTNIDTKHGSSSVEVQTRFICYYMVREDMAEDFYQISESSFKKYANGENLKSLMMKLNPITDKNRFSNLIKKLHPDQIESLHHVFSPYIAELSESNDPSFVADAVAALFKRIIESYCPGHPPLIDAPKLFRPGATENLSNIDPSNSFDLLDNWNYPYDAIDSVSGLYIRLPDNDISILNQFLGHIEGYAATVKEWSIDECYAHLEHSQNMINSIDALKYLDNIQVRSLFEHISFFKSYVSNLINSLITPTEMELLLANTEHMELDELKKNRDSSAIQIIEACQSNIHYIYTELLHIQEKRLVRNLFFIFKPQPIGACDAENPPEISKFSEDSFI